MTTAVQGALLGDDTPFIPPPTTRPRVTNHTNALALPPPPETVPGQLNLPGIPTKRPRRNATSNTAPRPKPVRCLDCRHWLYTARSIAKRLGPDCEAKRARRATITTITPAEALL